MDSILKVKQAAKILGCHENTIRNYDRTGRLPAGRDFNNCRIFALEDVLRFKRKIHSLETADGSGAHPGAHSE